MGPAVFQRSHAVTFSELVDKVLDTVKTAGLGDDIDRCDLIFQQPHCFPEFELVHISDRRGVQLAAEELHQGITGNLEFLLDRFQVGKTFR